MKAHPNQANRMVAVAGKMLTLAERWGWRPVGSNPCQLVERFVERKRRRYATLDELKAIGAAMDKYAEDPAHVSGVAFLLLLIFSGARPSEIERGTPDMIEVQGDAGVLRIEKGKTGERAVFLPPQAMRVIARLPKDRKNLAGRTTVPRALWRLIQKDSGCNDLWARDLRRTFATVALTGGVPIGVVGELLGHKSAQTTKVYAKLMEGGAHAAAASVAGRMEHLLTGAPQPG
jgi:integrase